MERKVLMKIGISRTIIILVLLLAPFSYLSAQEKISPTIKSAAATIAKFIEENGSTAAREKFKELVALKDVEYSFKESEFLRVGYEFLRTGKTMDAIEVFKMTSEVFPDSFNTYMSLGRAYRAIGNHDQDRKSVEKAFELENNKHLSEFLKKNKDTLAKTADEVIGRHLEAIGGRENLEKIKTMVITYSGFDSIDQETLVTRYYKFPHFVRQDSAASGTSVTTDGEKVWRIAAGKWKELENSNWIYAPDIYGDFIGYDKKGITYDFLGVEAIDRHIYYHLIKKYKDGEARDYYFSAETGLFRMERRDFGVGKDIKSQWDYRRHEGILIPHLFVVILGVGFGQTHGGILKDIKINIPLEDSLFRQNKN
jgi:tetratricopeptide (TPR) repeat protein